MMKVTEISFFFCFCYLCLARISAAPRRRSLLDAVRRRAGARQVHHDRDDPAGGRGVVVP